MGVFKLTFLTVGALGAAMLHFGRDDGLPADRLGLEPNVQSATIEPVSASVEAPVLVVSSRSEPIMRPTKAVARPGANITPPAPDTQAGRAIAAAQAMATASPNGAAPEPATAGHAFEMRYVSASAVNLRAGPSTRNGIVDRLTRGTAVLITGDTGTGWSQIKVADSGQRGFMASRFLSANQ